MGVDGGQTVCTPVSLEGFLEQALCIKLLSNPTTLAILPVPGACPRDARSWVSTALRDGWVQRPVRWLRGSPSREADVAPVHLPGPRVGAGSPGCWISLWAVAPFLLVSSSSALVS